MSRTNGKDREARSAAGTDSTQHERQMARAEIGHLQESVRALRDELEAQQLLAQQSVQVERQSASAEIQQLKSTAEALRGELEKQKLLIEEQNKRQEAERKEREEQQGLEFFGTIFQGVLGAGEKNKK